MDSDDPEKRIADLERQHAKDSQDRQPSGRGRKPWTWEKLLEPETWKGLLEPRTWQGLLIAFLIMSPVCAFAASFTVMYSLGTPTTVTDIVCNGALKRQSCTGTWNIDGQSHTGPGISPILPILGAGWPGFRVNDQTAYTGTRALPVCWPQCHLST